MPTNVDDDACQIDSKAGTMLWRLLLIYQQYSQLPAKHPVAKKMYFVSKIVLAYFEKTISCGFFEIRGWSIICKKI